MAQLCHSPSRKQPDSMAVERFLSVASGWWVLRVRTFPHVIRTQMLYKAGKNRPIHCQFFFETAGARKRAENKQLSEYGRGLSIAFSKKAFLTDFRSCFRPRRTHVQGVLEQRTVALRSKSGANAAYNTLRTPKTAANTQWRGGWCCTVRATRPHRGNH